VVNLTKRSLQRTRSIIAAGGDKGGGGGGGGSIESPNTLLSYQQVRVVHAICEGEIEGLVDGLRSVYLNKTPLLASGSTSITKQCDYDSGIPHIGLVTQNIAALEGIEVGMLVTGSGIPLGASILSINTDDNNFFFSLNRNPSSTLRNVTLTFQSKSYANFQDFAFYYRYGTQDQDHLPGFDSIETPLGGIPSTAVEVAQSLTVTVTDTAATAIRVAVSTPTFQESVVGDGGVTVKGSKVLYAIDVRPYGGSFVREVSSVIEGKAASQYVVQHRIELKGVGPWDVRLNRLTPDAVSQNVVNKIYFHSLISLVDLKLSYPNTAIFAGSFDARQFSAIPDVTYHLDLLKVKVPLNYNPVTRVYATSGAGTTNGVWNGTFKTAWTDNPAWAFYDLTTNERYGLGQYVSEASTDKYALYQIAQYCDELVPNGYGGTERRFTCNLFIQSREEAFRVIGNMASVFRGVTYWSAGKISFFQDRPTSAEYTITPSKVVKGLFNYSGSAVRARHNVAYVWWNDPADFSSRKMEAVQDRDAIRDMGVIREVTMTAFGCSSRGQARRCGRWALYAEQYETETINFETALDGISLYPGQVINVVDPDVAGVTLGGLVMAAATTGITLDVPVTFVTGKVYTALLINKDGDLVSRLLTNPGTGVSASVVTFQVAIGSDNVPLLNSQWAISVSDLAPQLFRVLMVSEASATTVKVGCLAYSPGKYNWVEADLPFNDPVVTALPKSLAYVAPPTQMKLSEEFEVALEGLERQLLASWIHSTDKYLKDYSVCYRFGDGNWIQLPNVSDNTVTFKVRVPSGYTVRVTANNIYGKSSAAVFAYYQLTNDVVSAGAVTGLELFEQANDLVWKGRDPHFIWRHNSPATAAALDAQTTKHPLLDRFLVSVYNMRTGSPVLLRQDDTELKSYVYSYEKNCKDTSNDPTRSIRITVVARDKAGNLSTAASLDFTNPSPRIGANPPTLDTDLFRMNSVGGRIQISYTRPTDSDFEGILIFVKKTTGSFVIGDVSSNGLTPNNAALVPYNREANTGMLLYKGTDTNISIDLDITQVYKIFFAPYDAFGLTALNFYGPTVLTVEHRYDKTAPNTPAGLAVTSRSEIDLDGTERVLLTAKWTPNAEADLLTYGWHLREVSALPVFTAGVLTGFGEATQIYTAIFGSISARNANAGFVQGTDGKVTFEWVVKPATYYEVRINSVDTSGNASAYTALTNVTVVISSKDVTAPSAPTDVTVTSAVRSVFLAWTNNSADKDYAKTRIYRGTATGFTPVYGTPYKEISGNSWTDSNTTIGTPYYYRLTNVDTSGNETSAGSDEVSTTPGKVVTSDITDFAVNLTKVFTSTIAFSNGSDGGTAVAWVDNTTTFTVSWNAHNIFYKGIKYAIAAGSSIATNATNARFIYWTELAAAYTSTDTNPTAATLGDDGFVIATNVGGVHDLAWNALANALIGTAYIQNLAVTDAKITSLTVDKITSGSITSKTITLQSGGVINSSAATSATVGKGFWIEGTSDGSFRFGDPAGSHIKWDGTTLALVGALSITGVTTLAAVATSGTYASLTTKPGSLAELNGTDGTKLSGIAAGATVGAVMGTNLSGGVFATPTSGAAGVYIDSTHMGYHTGVTGGAGGAVGNWKTYLDNAGKLYLSTGTNDFFFNGTALCVVTSGQTAAYNNAQTAFYVDGDGKFSLKDKLTWDGSTLTINGSGIFSGSLTAATIGAAGLTVTGGTGLHYADNTGVFTITGGVSNGVLNGAQIDLTGTAHIAGSRGVLLLSAGTPNTPLTSDAQIRFFTQARLVGTFEYNGNLSLNYSLAVTGAASAASFNAASSRRFKTNIETLTDATSYVKRLRTVTFDWLNGRGADVGVIAEEVAEVFPTFVHRNTGGEITGVDYGRLSSVLLSAVKELSSRLDALEHNN
jgi:predicted phage tail protein